MTPEEAQKLYDWQEAQLAAYFDSEDMDPAEPECPECGAPCFDHHRTCSYEAALFEYVPAHRDWRLLHDHRDAILEERVRAWKKEHGRDPTLNETFKLFYDKAYFESLAYTDNPLLAMIPKGKP